MNLTSTFSPRSRSRSSAPGAVAILYSKVGNVLRIPLRRTRTGGGYGCQQHPERQFIRWFNRQSAARPGFPAQVKSILLITGEPLCDSCYRALAGYLSRFHLAGKLRLRSTGPAPCGCGCGGQCNHPEPSDADGQLVAAASLLDHVIADANADLVSRRTYGVGGRSIAGPAAERRRESDGHWWTAY